jgi:hypothetical protein
VNLMVVKPAGCVRLIPQAILCLLRRGPVISEAVCLDHETQGAPVEIHSEAVHHPARLRNGKTPGTDESKERPLQLGVGEAEYPAVKEPTQSPDAGLASHPVECIPQLLWVCEVAFVCFVDRRFELPLAELGCNVDQGADRGRDRNAHVHRPIAGRKRTAPMKEDAPRPPVNRHGRRDLDGSRPTSLEPPVLGRGAVADHRFRAACEDRRHQASLMGQIRTAHSEDPTMKPVQAATCNAMRRPVGI